MFKERGSKFYAFAYPVESESDVKTRLELLRKEYFDASHHCYAYRLGPDGEKFRANDDGEPNHSAGDPILGRLRARELTNTLIVVVRYFGGQKLGVGGLISGYRAAVEDALGKTKTIEREITDSLTVEFNYEATPDVMKMASEFSMTIISQSFAEHCAMELAYPIRFEKAVAERVKLLRDLKKVFRLLSRH